MHAITLGLQFLVRVTNNRVQPKFPGPYFNRTGDQRPDWTENIGNYQANRVRALSLQASGQYVGFVAENTDGFLYPFDQIIAHIPALVHDRRNSCTGYACEICDILASYRAPMAA